MSERWLVWSNERRAWWRDAGRGYTLSLSDAGRYCRYEAIAICRHARNGWREGAPPSEIPVRESDVLEAADAMLAARATPGEGGK